MARTWKDSSFSHRKGKNRRTRGTYRPKRWRNDERFNDEHSFKQPRRFRPEDDRFPDNGE